MSKHIIQFSKENGRIVNSEKTAQITYFPK